MTSDTEDGADGENRVVMDSPGIHRLIIPAVLIVMTLSLLYGVGVL